MPHLRITEPEPGSAYELPAIEYAEVVVGTAPYCQLCLPEVKGLAAVHACIVCKKQGYMITDLNTSCGTLEGGVPIRGTVPMKPEVEYRMGDLCVVLEKEPETQRVEASVVSEPAARPSTPEVVPVYVPMQQPMMMPQSVPMQQPMMMPQSMPMQQPMMTSQSMPMHVQEVRIVQQVVPPPKKVPITSKQRKRELSVLMARLHRRKRYNYTLWIFLWFFLTALMVTALVVFILPEESKKGVERYLDEKVRVYEKEGVPGLFRL